MQEMRNSLKSLQAKNAELAAELDATKAEVCHSICSFFSPFGSPLVPHRPTVGSVVCVFLSAGARAVRGRSSAARASRLGARVARHRAGDAAAGGGVLRGGRTAPVDGPNRGGSERGGEGARRSHRRLRETHDGTHDPFGLMYLFFPTGTPATFKPS
jgi:hypothetical protein